MNNDDLVQTALRLFECAARGDVTGYLEHVDPAVEAWPLTRPGVVRGHQGIRAFFRGRGPHRVENLRLGTAGQTVIATGTLAAPGYLGGVLELPAAWVLRFENERLVSSASFQRLEQALLAAGISPDEIELRPASSSV